METLVKLDLNIFCAVTLAVLGVNYATREERRFTVVRLFLVMVWTNLALLTVDSACWTLEGRSGPAARAANYCLNLAYFLIHPIPPLVYILYGDYRARGDYLRLRTMIRRLCALYATFVALILYNLKTGWLYSVDSTNHYFRGPFYPIYIAIAYSLIAYLFFFIMINRHKIDRREFLPLILFPIPPMIGGFLQLVFFGTTFLWPGMTLSLLVVYLHVQNLHLNKDALTGVYTRRFLDDYLEERLRNQSPEERFSGILVDIDDFHQLNRALGHVEGDRALQALTVSLRESIRGGDFLARFAGDEFAIIVGTDDQTVIDAVEARIVEGVERLNASGKLRGKLTVSLGSTVFVPGHEGAIDLFIKRLAESLYSAKLKKRRSRIQTPAD